MSQEPLSLIESQTDRPRQVTECRHCGSWWTGLNTCHCTACHTTFTGITAFDAHRTGSHTNDTRTCLAPTELVDGKGNPKPLVDAGRAYSCWGFPAAENPHWANKNA